MRQRLADVLGVEAVLGDQLGRLGRERLGLVGVVGALRLGQQLADLVEQSSRSPVIAAGRLSAASSGKVIGALGEPVEALRRRQHRGVDDRPARRREHVVEALGRRPAASLARRPVRRTVDARRRRSSVHASIQPAALRSAGPGAARDVVAVAGDHRQSRQPAGDVDDDRRFPAASSPSSWGDRWTLMTSNGSPSPVDLGADGDRAGASPTSARGAARSALAADEAVGCEHGQPLRPGPPVVLERPPPLHAEPAGEAPATATSRPPGGRPRRVRRRSMHVGHACDVEAGRSLHVPGHHRHRRRASSTPAEDCRSAGVAGRPRRDRRRLRSRRWSTASCIRSPSRHAPAFVVRRPRRGRPALDGRRHRADRRHGQPVVLQRRPRPARHRRRRRRADRRRSRPTPASSRSPTRRPTSWPTALAELSPIPSSRVFLCGSGSEAVDTAIKLARLAHAPRRRPEAHRRHQPRSAATTARTSAAPAPRASSRTAQGWGPLVPDIVQAPADDIEALSVLMAERGDEVAAVLIEPVQGAGGVFPPPPGYLAEARALCDRHGALLVFDEVITGFGRLGHVVRRRGVRRRARHDHVRQGGDVGIPAGRRRDRRAARCASRWSPTTASSSATATRTPVTPRPAPRRCATSTCSSDEALLARAEPLGKRLAAGLESLAADGVIDHVRGTGAVWAAGLRPDQDAMAIRDAMLAGGVVTRAIGTDTLHVLPAARHDRRADRPHRRHPGDGSRLSAAPTEPASSLDLLRCRRRRSRPRPGLAGLSTPLARAASR